MIEMYRVTLKCPACLYEYWEYSLNSLQNETFKWLKCTGEAGCYLKLSPNLSNICFVRWTLGCWSQWRLLCIWWCSLKAYVNIKNIRIIWCCCEVCRTIAVNGQQLACPARCFESWEYLLNSIFLLKINYIKVNGASELWSGCLLESCEYLKNSISKSA